MRKKYLSALLFGALLFASTGTFTSCKDYDDDIEGLRTDIASLQEAVSALQSTIDAGNYVTSVTGNGNQLTFNFSNGEPTTITVDDGQEAQTITFSEEGEMLINGEGTGVYAHEPYVPEEPTDPDTPAEPEAPEVGLVKAQEGTWWVLGEDGEYTNTNIPVSAVTAVGNDEDGYTLTIYGTTAEDTQEIFIPGASSMISSIVLEDEGASLQVIRAEFTRPSEWAGPRTLPSSGSVIYSANQGIKVRINPVDAPATDVTYTLVNSKNQELSNIELTAKADNSLLTTDNANGRAAGTSNGLYVLNMEEFTLGSTAAESFEDQFNNKNNNAHTVAFAINANVSTRSAYDVAVNALKDADALNKIVIKQGSTVVDDSEVDVDVNLSQDANNDGTNDANAIVEVNVGQTYTIDEASKAVGTLYDMYFEIDQADIDAFGITFDNAAKTFTVSQNPDVVTTRPIGFYMTVHTLDTRGNVKDAVYRVNLSAVISSDVLTYDPVTFNIDNLGDTDNNNDGFNIAMSELRTALGDNWTPWVNSVDIDNTEYAIYTDADCEDAVTGGTQSLTFTSRTADGNTATSARNLEGIYATVQSANAGSLKLATQYYLKVTFKDNSNAEVNSIVVPVTFTAPTVADQFTRDANFVVNDVITAYFYNTDNKQINIERYFTEFDGYATLTLDTETTLATVGNTEYKSAGLATIAVPSTGTTTPNTINNDAYITLNTGNNNALVNGATGIELGYGKNLIVVATNDKYGNTGWLYGNEADKTYRFTISIMSPIYEGTVTAVEGESIPVIANNESGYPITGSMITGVDYNNNKYSVVPNTSAKGTPNNTASNTIDAWSSAQIKNVYVTPDNAEYFNGGISLRTPGGTKENPIEGAIVVKATPMPNTTKTSITVHVTDVWGYTKAVSVPVTIQVGE